MVFDNVAVDDSCQPQVFLKCAQAFKGQVDRLRVHTLAGAEDVLLYFAVEALQDVSSRLQFGGV